MAYRLRMRRFLIGLAGGVVVGYTLIRAREAMAELRSQAPASEPDSVAYGKLRRALMLADIARSFATLAVIAYTIGPRIEPPDGMREARAHRIALIASGIVASSILELPADYIEGFVLERRYGLSKQSAGAWLIERAKALGVSLALTVPLVELLVFAIERAPGKWPLVATLGTIPLFVLANVIAPTYIAPLFNTFVPIEGPFADEVRGLATRYGAGDATLLRVDMSRQTEKANAYVTGLFGTKRIVIGDTLLEHFEARETLFIVAHELGHYVSRDVWRAVPVEVCLAAVIFFGSRRLAERPGRTLATTAGLARLLFVMSLLGTLAGPLLASYSRSRERAADTFAIEATGDSVSGAAAFRRLRERNLAEDEQPRWMELLFSSHPSLRSRIERVEAAGASGA